MTQQQTPATATVEVLTAEVRTLMVGSRQITLSVFGQLDLVAAEDMEPFGRVRSGKLGTLNLTELVGRHKGDGSLVRAIVPRPPSVSDLLIDTYQGDPWFQQRRGAFVPSKKVTIGVHTLEVWREHEAEPYDGNYKDPDWRIAPGAESALRSAIGAAERWEAESVAEIGRLESLPLIVLAGLR